MRFVTEVSQAQYSILLKIKQNESNSYLASVMLVVLDILIFCKFYFSSNYIFLTVVDEHIKIKHIGILIGRI